MSFKDKVDNKPKAAPTKIDVSGLQKKLGEASHPKTKLPTKKAGRPAHKIKRKLRQISLSDDAMAKFKKAESLINLAGIELSRGRSEAHELAIHYLVQDLSSKDEAVRNRAIGTLKDWHNFEENNLLD